MRPIGTQKQLEQRRKRAVELLNGGLGIRETARQVGASPSSVVRWRDAYKKGGCEALTSKPPPHRPCRLTDKQLQLFQKILLKGATASEYKTELWTLKRIAAVMRKHFGVDYQLSGVWYILTRLGWSCQKPQKRAMERDQRDIEAWRKSRWPDIKKLA
jgi:transposase